jgi:hypothetical protein
VPRDCKYIAQVRADLSEFATLYKAATEYADGSDRFVEVQPGHMTFHFHSHSARSKFCRYVGGLDLELIQPHDDDPHKEWPPYRVGNPDYIHALGVISAVFNLLEFRFRALFPLYVGLQLPYKLFAKSHNYKRLGLVREGLKSSPHPDSIKKAVGYFLTGYETGVENRNVLMHSTMFFIFGPGDIPCPTIAPLGHQPQGVGFQKFLKGDPYQINIYRLTIEELRAHADALKDLEVYGDRLFWHILKHYEPKRSQSWGIPKEAKFPLPSKPSLPRIIVPVPADTERE